MGFRPLDLDNSRQEPEAITATNSRQSICQLLFNYIMFFIILQFQHKVTANTQGPIQTLTKLTWQCVSPLVWDGTCRVGLFIVDYSSRKQHFDHNLLARNRLRDKCQRVMLKACFYIGLRHHLLHIPNYKCCVTRHETLLNRATHLCNMQWRGWPPKLRHSHTPNMVVLGQTLWA